MKRTFHAVLLALFLAAIGLGIFIHKLTASDVPLLPNQAFNSWYVEAKLSLVDSQPLPLSADEDLPSTIQFHLPLDSQRYEIVKEDFINEGFERKVETLDKAGNRVAVFTKQDATDSSEILFYRAIIRRKPTVQPGVEDVAISGRRLVDKELVKFGENTERAEDNVEENLPTAEIKALLNEAKKQSSDRPSFAKQIYQLALRRDDIRVQSIRRNLRKEESASQLAAFLLKQANVPARVGNGIYLRSDEVYSTDFIRWLKIQVGDRWLAYDPLDLSFKEQDRYLTWWYGSDRVLQAQGSSNIDLEVVVQPNTDNGLTRSILRGRRASNVFLEYSFLKLPLGTQRVFQVLVLIPIGALIISVLHQIVGLKTFK